MLLSIKDSINCFGSRMDTGAVKELDAVIGKRLRFDRNPDL